MLLLCAESEKCLESAGPEGCEKFHDLLNEMAVCAREHFAKEEELLLARHYPMVAEHAEEHERFQTALVDFLFSAVQGEQDKIGVFRFLSEWCGFTISSYQIWTVSVSHRKFSPHGILLNIRLHRSFLT